MNITVEKTMEMPTVVLFARELEAALKKEAENRKRFYAEIVENKKMEFINGEIYFQSPVRVQHNRATLSLATLVDSYVKLHKLGFVGVGKILVSLTRNDYEPDICFFGKEKAEDIRLKQMQLPAPDFVVEVLSDSTEQHDRETKFLDYAAHGVLEYWIIDPDKQTVEQYIAEGGEYDLILKAGDGHIESRAVPGFRIAIRSIFDDAENLAELQRILSS